jgi:PEP-CTERM motif
MNSRKATPALLAAFVLALFSGAAHAATITFDTGTTTHFGSSFAGSVTENGYTYSTSSGSLFLSPSGNPGNDMEGNEEFGGGILNIVSSTSANFTFAAIDFSAYGAAGSETLTVTGLLNGVVEGVATYTLADSLQFPYSWTTEDASTLAGVTINDLHITLNADSGSHSANVDNVVLNPAVAATPEPSSFVLLGTGILGTLGALKRRFAA